MRARPLELIQLGPGRPTVVPTAGTGSSVTVAARIPADLKIALIAAAQKNGRTLSEEIVARLLRTFPAATRPKL